MAERTSSASCFLSQVRVAPSYVETEGANDQRVRLEEMFLDPRYTAASSMQEFQTIKSEIGIAMRAALQARARAGGRRHKAKSAKH